MGKLTTHVLDTASGAPAAGMKVTLQRFDGAGPQTIVAIALNRDGRCDVPLLEGAGLARARYRLIFAVGEYFRARGVTLAEPPFIDDVPLDFGVADPSAHYHVPLLVSPFSYATYRGS